LVQPYTLIPSPLVVVLFPAPAPPVLLYRPLLALAVPYWGCLYLLIIVVVIVIIVIIVVLIVEAFVVVDTAAVVVIIQGCPHSDAPPPIAAVVVVLVVGGEVGSFLRRGVLAASR
jgi:hypothetical protein